MNAADNVDKLFIPHRQMQQLESICLVNKQDPSYRDFNARVMRVEAEKNRLRLKDPFAADHYKVRHDLETATFQLFATNHDVQTGLILKAPRLVPSNFGIFEFLEVDFVCFHEATPVVFGELKFSITPDKAKRSAYEQVARRLYLANQRWPKARGMVVCYSTSSFMDQGVELPGAESEVSFFDALSEALDSSEFISVYDLKFKSLCEDLLAMGTIDEALLRRFRITFDEMRSPLQSPFSPLRPNNGFNSLGNAFNNLAD
jgi:hypothetical protein